MDVVSDVPYTDNLDNPRLQFDLYVPRQPSSSSSSPSSAPRPLLCFVHGGAWRSEDKRDHAALAAKLVSTTGLCVLVPNYRLTPQSPTPETAFQHPAHAQDILRLLTFIPTWSGPDSSNGRPFDENRIFLIGHSCAAHMLASIFLDSSAVTPELTPSPAMLLAVRGLILAEGIYDIDALVDRFPNYRMWFIDGAFGERDSYADVSVTSLPTRTTHIRWLILHSTADELVNIEQSEAMHRHLCDLYAGVPQVDYHVGLSVNDFGGHLETLSADAFVEGVAAFVKDKRSSTL
ncbi:alpha/beta-hydrolase [Cylindrobasidium torrendii FP15055 ss-10]|uniref:Alpha/beta-hydrolase n=1 Tax=Cylindrobasidium torrendii FP15055 ss-10 TaxID=1314674 RepID=A0A0D7B195_9AGAR|nr:alpha/beta-hydrolase [Cylindrobasidium torrendii FP15055 ss-10]